MGGNDLLEGGIGFDTYIYNAGDGLDRIEDSDAQGKIILMTECCKAGFAVPGCHEYVYES